MDAEIWGALIGAAATIGGVWGAIRFERNAERRRAMTDAVAGLASAAAAVGFERGPVPGSPDSHATLNTVMQAYFRAALYEDELGPVWHHLRRSVTAFNTAAWDWWFSSPDAPAQTRRTATEDAATDLYTFAGTWVGASRRQRRKAKTFEGI